MKPEESHVGELKEDQGEIKKIFHVHFIKFVEN